MNTAPLSTTVIAHRACLERGALTVGSTLADQSRIPVLPRVGDRLLKE